MGRTAAITGAASGIGQAAALRLLTEGWTVFGLDVSEHRLRAVSQDACFKPIVCDVADANRVVAAFADIAFAVPALDALICCAGILRTGPLESMSVADFDQVFAVNTRGTWLCVREALPLLRKSATADAPARIVLLSSVAALRPKISGGAYAASKAAVSQLCRRAGGRGGGERRAGERAGAGDRRYADDPGGQRSGQRREVSPVGRVPDRPHRIAG